VTAIPPATAITTPAGMATRNRRTCRLWRTAARNKRSLPARADGVKTRGLGRLISDAAVNEFIPRAQPPEGDQAVPHAIRPRLGRHGCPPNMARPGHGRLRNGARFPSPHRAPVVRCGSLWIGADLAKDLAKMPRNGQKYLRRPSPQGRGAPGPAGNGSNSPPAPPGPPVPAWRRASPSMREGTARRRPHRRPAHR
jgi:hypothetical protein